MGLDIIMVQRLATQWARICARLRAEYGESAYKNWLKPLTVIGEQENIISLNSPTIAMRDRINSQYAQRLLNLWQSENPKLTEINITCDNNIHSQHEANKNTDSSSAISNGPDVFNSMANGDFDSNLSAPINERYSFDQFIVGKPNELAFAAAKRVSEADSVPFNPLFLYGGVGLGKTHLMHAIAGQIRQTQPEKRIIYLSAEKFMYQFVRALRYKDMMSFKDQFRSVDILMIDDVQFIAGKESTQEEFFHTFNALVDQNRQVIISADKSPADLDGIEERMKSRLGWGLVAEIHSTTYELRLGILHSKAENMGVHIQQNILEFLAHKITSNVRELEGALNRLVAYANLVGREVSLESAQDVLRDLLRTNDRRVTIEEIQKRVAEHYNIKMSEMHSARRSRAIVRPRQVAMYLAKQLTMGSLPEIGHKFGGRDHTTVMHAVKKIDSLCNEDKNFAEDVELLSRMLSD